MRNILSAGGMLLLGVTLLVAGSQTPAVTEQGERLVQHRKGKPLSQLIKDGIDGVVVVEKDQSAPHYIEPPKGTSQLEWMTSRAPFVLVVRIDTLDAFLTSDEDWITTTVNARVEMVLKKPAGDALAEGLPLIFVQDGGEINLMGTPVRAVLPWADGFKEGARYLVFAERFAKNGQWQIEPGTAYKVTSPNDRLKPLARSGKALSEANVPLEQAASRIQAAAKHR